MACPAWNSGTALNPKHLVMDIRNQMLAEGGVPYSAIGGFINGYTNPTVQPGAALVGDVIRDETLWACTTCRACVYECPVFINHVDAIIDMRRYLVMTEGRMPDTITDDGGTALQENHHHLPALLQHNGQRIQRLWWRF